MEIPFTHCKQRSPSMRSTSRKAIKMVDDSSGTHSTSTQDDCSSLSASSASRSSPHPPSVTTTRSLPEYPADRLEEAETNSFSCSEPCIVGERRSPNDMLPQELLDTNNVEALTKVLSRYKRKYGQASQEVAHVYNFIGNSHFRRREYQLAVEAYKQAIACAPGNHLGDSYANLGTVYWTIGDLDEAMSFLKLALNVHECAAIARKEDPLNCLNIATVAYQLGIVYTLKSDFDAAMRQFSICQDIRERMLPPNHVDVARVLDAIGKVYTLRNSPGDLPTALRYHEEAFQIKHRIPKRRRDPALLATTLQSIAQIHMKLGDYHAAIYSNKLLLKTLRRLLHVPTKDCETLHLDIQATYETLWRLHRLIKDNKQAEHFRHEARLFLERVK